MWRQSVWTSTISAAVAANYLKEGGVLALTGAKPALQGNITLYIHYILYTLYNML